MSASINNFKMCRLKTHFASDLVQHMRDSGHDLEDPLVNCPECKSNVPIACIEDHYSQCIQALFYRVAKCHMMIYYLSNDILPLLSFFTGNPENN